MGEPDTRSQPQAPLSPIGETRWWSKHDAVKKVFGQFGKPQNGLFTDVVLTLRSKNAKKPLCVLKHVVLKRAF